MADLLELHRATPELFTVGFLIATWEAFLYDFLDRMFEGMRRLGQFCRPSDDIAEIRRLALNRLPDGGLIWQHPLSFNMISSRGYWRLNIIPRLEASVEKVGYGIALQKIVGGKKLKNDSVVGAVAKQLYPMGNRLYESEIDTMTQNCSHKSGSGTGLCLDYNAHSGCVCGINCNFAHEYFGGKNLNWCVEAELLRRGGFRKRKKMLAEAVEINALVYDLREKNAKYHGEQLKWPEVEPTKVTPAIVGKKVSDNSMTVVDKEVSVASQDSVVVTCLDSSGKMDWEVGDSWKAHIAHQMNKNFAVIPGDFPHFDFTEAESIGRNLIFPDESWMYHEVPSLCKSIPLSKLTERQRIIAEWWKETCKADSAVAPFLLNWLDARSTSDDWDGEYRKALEYLTHNGKERDCSIAQEELRKIQGISHSAVVGRSSSRIKWGASVALSDCSGAELAVGQLHFHVIEYGDSVHLGEKLQKLMNVGGDTERNQCACLSLEAGIERMQQE